MLIIPVPEKLTRHNLPWIAIALILVNCVVYFVLQAGDSERYLEAQSHYFTTRLAEIELAAYRAYQQGVAPEGFEPLDTRNMSQEQKGRLFRAMHQDTLFQNLLRDEAVIAPAHADYLQWRELRDEYDQLLSKVTVVSHGFVPAEARPVTLLTYMFMHASLGHLLGNMLFLFLAGVVLEMGCGRILTATSYLVTGLGAVALFWVIYSDSHTPLVGASGAIAGLMGALTVLYGRKKIRMFIYLGFYFHYRRVPAIWLLPPWVGLELYRLFFHAGSNVAYVAHIGGLISGAAIGFAMSRLLKNRDIESLQPEAEDTITPLIEQALERIRELNLAEGEKLLQQALVQDPGHIDALTHLFNLRKNDPRTAGFHQIAGRLLRRLSGDASNFARAREIYEAYLKATGRPRLSPDLYLRISVMLSGLGEPEKAERIIALFLKQKPNYPGLPAALLSLAGQYRQKQNRTKYQTCLKLLQTRYPASAEGQLAADQAAKMA
jgi:membrane associated rhomboid family serine protease